MELNGGGSIIHGATDLIYINQENSNTVVLGDNSGVSISHSSGNSAILGQSALIGVTDGNNETFNLGNNATAWLTHTTGSTLNMSWGYVYAYDGVNVTINGSGNTVGALDGDTVNVAGNGQRGSANLVYLSNGALNLAHDADAAITGNNNIVHADQTDLVTVNGNHNTLQFGSNGLTWVQTGYGNVIDASGAGILIGDNVINTSIVGDGNAIYTGTGDNLNVSGSGDTIYGSGSTIYLNADALNTQIQGDNDIIHVRAGSVYQVTWFDDVNESVTKEEIVDGFLGAGEFSLFVAKPGTAKSVLLCRHRLSYRRGPGLARSKSEAGSSRVLRRRA
ncbi:hypothetical protein QA649_34570 [Bradyrhizobium sp. CB1717]|uniref:hypothetical protein n=1 Tax=Bradyrhizobium sp. CB1717 TaxID=3039154 RepID=UPI0024B04D2E|nr:hypothetical protein [Bradyrhizobium sp. CB1717]WFU23168.1 hypothetical protein QA649_34570 [Bradyrhizobium sp. CB1717]